MEIEIVNIPSVMTSKYKAFGINLTKYMQNLCTEDYKTLMIEMQKYQNKYQLWNKIECPEWTHRFMVDRFWQKGQGVLVGK